MEILVHATDSGSSRVRRKIILKIILVIPLMIKEKPRNVYAITVYSYFRFYFLVVIQLQNNHIDQTFSPITRLFL